MIFFLKIFFFFSLLFPFLSKTSLAQGEKTNYFTCSWNDTDKKCVFAEAHCDPLYSPDKSRCDAFKSKVTCNQVEFIKCTTSQNRYTCSPLGGCVPDIKSSMTREQCLKDCKPKPLPTLPPSNPELCCPEGFSDSPSACPLAQGSSPVGPVGFTPGVNCCRQYGWGNYYDVVDKVSCLNGSITGKYCCPVGANVDWLSCGAIADTTKFCCKRTGLFSIDLYEKVQCTIPASGNIHAGCGSEALRTAIGCIPFVNITSFMSFTLTWVIGVAGGVALLLIIVGGFQILTSSGKPESIKSGKELITAAITGLVLLIFSVFILRVIGVDIIKIPNFGSL